MMENGNVKSDYKTILVDRHDNGLVTITLNRPEMANAVNTDMGLELLDVWTDLVRKSDGLRCVVFTGAGNDAFCGGGDMKQRKGMDNYAWRHQHQIFEEALRAMMECPIPVIAAVNGKAVGGGLEMTLAADFAYGVDTAQLWFPETSIGILPGVGGTTLLPRIVGERRANEIIFSAKPISAAQALEWGIFNGVCSAKDLMPTVMAVAGGIIQNAPLAVVQAKKAIHEGMQMDQRTALRFEYEAYNLLTGTQDRVEGTLAWNEKRKPLFKGC